MADEMLAAKPDRLPKLKAKPVRVPVSGKRFRKVDPAAMRRAWYERGARG